MGGDVHAVWVTYEEAQKLRPLLRHFMEAGKWAETKRNARDLLKELEIVRPLSGTGLDATQVLLTPHQEELLTDLMNSLGM